MTLAKATDIAIGLLLVVLLASLVASATTELLATLIRKRAKDLWKAVHKLVDETQPVPPAEGTTSSIAGRPKLADARPGDVKQTPDAVASSVTAALYASPFVNEFRDLDSSGRTLISKLRSSDFARGLLWVGTAEGGKTPDEVIDRLRERLPTGSPAMQVLDELTVEAAHTLEGIGNGLATWFDNQMARLTRQYRRWARYVALVVGLVIAIGANVDIVFIARTLNRNDALRAAAVSEANSLVASCANKTGDALTQCLNQQVQSAQNVQGAIQLPIGWNDPASRRFGGLNGLWKVLGWALLAVATMQGAPFWFDLLRRLVGLR
jgi:hypothetical protein